MKKGQLLSVIIPAYREAKTIRRDIKRIEEILKQLRYAYEIIVVADGRYGTEDKTFEEAKKVESDKVHVHGYSKNMGKGYAVRYGMSRSKGEIVAFIDSGMEISPNSLSMALEHLEWYGADIIVGSKYHPASKVSLSRMRRITSAGYRLLIWLLFHLNLRDTQVGMKIFKRRVLEDVLPRLLVKRYAFDVEMLSVAYSLGYRRIFEAPIVMTPALSPLTSDTTIKAIFRMLWDTMAVFYRLKIRRYYSNRNRENWKCDPDLNFKVGTS